MIDGHIIQPLDREVIHIPLKDWEQLMDWIQMAQDLLLTVRGWYEWKYCPFCQMTDWKHREDCLYAKCMENT